jgi:hypothetical protein
MSLNILAQLKAVKNEKYAGNVAYISRKESVQVLSVAYHKEITWKIYDKWRNYIRKST